MAAPPTIDDLGTDGALYLLALVSAQAGRRLVTPTRQLTLHALGVLKDQAVIAVPWPQARWDVEPRAQSTPLEDLQWRYDWAAYPAETVGDAIAEYLQQVPRDSYGIELRLRLWRELFTAESQQYFEFQLGRSHLPVEWAADTRYLVDAETYALSLAQWRYCFWAAVRQGGAMSAQRVYSLSAIRERVFEEARRRAASIASSRWSVQGYDARADEPLSALTRAFLRHLAPIGTAFYHQPPSASLWRRGADGLH